MWRRVTLLTRSSSSCFQFSTNVSLKKPLFDKILIANRGEIAVRVIQTCKRLGIKTVQIYSEPDVNSVAVRMADQAVCVGPAASVDSYLNIPNILAAVQSTGAQAVHPGYGFLSENKDFCKALEEIQVEFIGPGQMAISAMGDKIESKKVAIAAGVNTIPGFLAVMQNEEEVVKVSNDIGCPVMIKASAGGGGKGMRVAYNDEEAREGYRFSKEEAASAFGDDRLFIEKFIEDPRHIEIQLIADKHGNIVPFPERECSIQRRNQKVIEEAPSMLLTKETRLAMGEQAKMLAKAVDYHSAGTVEFLCDKNQNFYFLEMNTRLQVEHPVTELISGVDLVEEMIRIAAGYKIPDHMLKGPLPIQGWAMESRVYAEDPLRGFLPSTGRLLQYEEPNGEGVRVDSGVVEGSDISMFYDPMISKLITHGDTREECLQRMKDALNHYVIKGPGHNLSFLSDLYRHPRFISGDITTKFIEEEYPDGFKGVLLVPSERNELVGASLHLFLSDQSSACSISQVSCTNNMNVQVISNTLTRNVKSGHFTSTANNTVEETGSVLFNATPSLFQTVYISTEGSSKDTSRVDYITLNDTLLFKIDGSDLFILADVVRTRTCLTMSINEVHLTVQLQHRLPTGYQLVHHGAAHSVSVLSTDEHELVQFMLLKPKVDTSKSLFCPMPGVLISVAVQEGDVVEIGQELAVVEAMKMQNVLRAEKSGTIDVILHTPGSSLKVDDIILEFQ